MSFLREMLSSDAKISSKRFVGFMAFFMLICSWGADTFSAFEVKDKILECFMYISVVGLGVTALPKNSVKNSYSSKLNHRSQIWLKSNSLRK